MNADRCANRVALGLRVLAVLALATVAGRVIQLQAFPGDDLRAAIDARTSGSRLDPLRGDLLDRRGRVLATTRVGWRVIVDPVHAGDRADEVIVALSEELGMRPDEVGLRLMRAAAENERRRMARAETPAATAEAGLGSGLSSGLGTGARGWLADRGLIRSREGVDAGARGLIRYVPITGVVTREQADAVRARRLPGVFVERQPVREIVGGDTVAPLVGKFGFPEDATERRGVLGAERRFDERLTGNPGSLRYVRDSRGRPLWVERGAWRDAEPGRDVRLSIDAHIQRVVAEELGRGVDDADAAGGRAIVLDPHTGEILAMVDIIRDVPGLVDIPWHDPTSDRPRQRMPEGVRFRVLREDPGRRVEPAMARNRCVEEIYEPGSTFKTFIWAAAHDLGRLKPGEMLRNETRTARTWYGRRIQDVTFRDEMTWDDVLTFSSNIGMYEITERLSHQEAQRAIRGLGFGSSTNLGIPGESAGMVTRPRDWTKYTQTSVGMGYEVGATMVQMVRAFSVFARRDDDAGTLPGVRLTAAGIDESRPGVIGEEVFVERVFSPESALAVRKPLAATVDRMDAARLRKNPQDVPSRYPMFGKSGTAYIPVNTPPGLRRPIGAGGYITNQYTSSFLAAAPTDDPEVVILVVIDDPGPGPISRREHYGSHVAGPVVRRISERVLPYLGVPIPPGKTAN
ncbi:MAG: penicillin-binding protein 2 [Phycisphaerales bacterium]|nr:penicillin-binding protein 2 [Planctomycetota bacterium]MCH8507419.1 penicillin-binding protein 2 [Phycisphaerales bacterium]